MQILCRYAVREWLAPELRNCASPEKFRIVMVQEDVGMELMTIFVRRIAEESG